jgi:hypothetical protein
MYNQNTDPQTNVSLIFGNAFYKKSMMFCISERKLLIVSLKLVLHIQGSHFWCINYRTFCSDLKAVPCTEEPVEWTPVPSVVNSTKLAAVLVYICWQRLTLRQI